MDYPYILVVSSALKETKELLNLLDKIKPTKKPLVVISEDI
jgi:hypothetical protein